MNIEELQKLVHSRCANCAALKECEIFDREVPVENQLCPGWKDIDEK